MEDSSSGEKSEDLCSAEDLQERRLERLLPSRSLSLLPSSSERKRNKERRRRRRRKRRRRYVALISSDQKEAREERGGGEEEESQIGIFYLVFVSFSSFFPPDTPFPISSSLHSWHQHILPSPPPPHLLCSASPTDVYIPPFP